MSSSARLSHTARLPGPRRPSAISAPRMEMKASATVEVAACPGELAAWCGGWQGQLGAVPDQLAAA